MLVFVTLPLLIALTAGTAFSARLAQNTFLVGVISTVIFVGGLALAFKWTGEAKPPLPDIYAGVPKVTLVTSPACGAACEDGKAVWRAAQGQVNFKQEVVQSEIGGRKNEHNASGPYPAS